MRDPNQLVRVYRLYDVRIPARSRYVGITIKPLPVRLGQYRRLSRWDRHHPVPLWIAGIGEESLAIDLLAECVWKDRHEHEARWILEERTLRSRWPDGLNDSLGKMISDRQRALISDGNKRAWQDPELRARRSAQISAARRRQCEKSSG